MKKLTPKTLGLNDDHVSYLTHMSQQMHAPGEFHDEAQLELNKLANPTPAQNLPFEETQMKQDLSLDQEMEQKTPGSAPAK